MDVLNAVAYIGEGFGGSNPPEMYG